MRAFIAAGALLFSSSCINYSSYQDARIVERDVSQGTVGVSASKYQSEYDYDDFDWFVVDMNPRWGLGGRFDAALRMSLLLTEDNLGWVVLGGDVRVGVIPDYLAVTVPISISLGEYAFSSTNLQPGIVVTLPVVDEIDLNGSVRRSFYLSEDIEPNAWWLYNAGLGIVIAPGWRLRPELGWMVPENDYDEGTYVQFGIGVTREVPESSGP